MLREPDAVTHAFASARDALGPIDILINNAGQAQARRRSARPISRLWQRMLDVNLTGVFLCTQAVLPTMLRARIRPHRQYREHGGADRLPVCRRLLRGEARRDRSDALARARSRARRTSRSMRSAPAIPTPTLLRASLAHIVAKDRPQRRSRRAPRCCGRIRKPLHAAARKSRTRCCGCACRDRKRSPGQAISVSGGEVM